MKSLTLQSLGLHLLRIAAAFGIVFSLAACGSGKGDDDADSPAPQTMNGILLITYQGGPTFRFVRAEGNAVGGTEFGAVTMDAEPARRTYFDSGGAGEFMLVPPTRISGGRYSYTRTTPESGTIIITGESTDITAQKNAIGPLLPPVTYMTFPPATPFERRFEILFGTDGVSITGITFNDSGESNPFPGIFHRDADILLQNNSPVPIAWNITDSALLDLPSIYPDQVSMEVLIFTPDDPLADTLSHQLLESTFTRFSNAPGDFVEKGVGNRDVLGGANPQIINFEYDPDPTTINRAEMRIILQSGEILTYDLRFLDFENGTYTLRNDGSTGVFAFPFIEN
jgi:hypothetical protein